jgi:membrane-anchored glycerophosphoryl diester phosphodiesterase (GDPDase)
MIIHANGSCYDSWQLTKENSMEFLFGFGILGSLIALALGLFWVWMLVDCLANQSEDKLVWFLVIFFLNLLGAFLYYLLARKKRLV